MIENPKIIIVDDNITFLDGLKFYLQEVKNYQVINTAKNGNEFLKLENIHLADVILMDIEMPEINGLETAKKILLKESYLKIIAITNYQDKVYLSELVEKGFKGCVLKKNIYGQIDRAIQKVIAGKLHYPYTINI